MFGDRKNRDSEVGCFETERTGTVGWGVWRQKEHGQWGVVFGDRKNRDSGVWCFETERTGTVGCGVLRQKEQGQ